MEKNQLVEIRNFISVAQHESFTIAAQTLGLTGSALSKSIVRLENRLGTKLLNRTTRRVSLTNDGALYLSDCKDAIAILEKAENRLGSENQTPIGKVRIDLPVTFGKRFILPILLDISKRYEQLELSITFNDTPIDLISDGIDLAIRVGKPNETMDIVSRSLGVQKRLICGSPSYFKKYGVPQVKADLTYHQCIVGWPLGQKRYWLLKDDDGNTEAYEIAVKHEIADCEAILAAILAGEGLAQVPMWLVESYLKADQLISVLDEYAVEGEPINAVWIKKPYMQPKMRVIIDELVSNFNIK